MLCFLAHMSAMTFIFVNHVTRDMGLGFGFHSVQSLYCNVAPYAKLMFSKNFARGLEGASFNIHISFFVLLLTNPNKISVTVIGESTGA